MNTNFIVSVCSFGYVFMRLRTRTDLASKSKILIPVKRGEHRELLSKSKQEKKHIEQKEMTHTHNYGPIWNEK